MAAPLFLSSRTTTSVLSRTTIKYAIQQPTNALLLRLPPSCRAFHVSPKPQAILEPLLTSTHTILTTIHSTTYLPWCCTIPLAALLLRLTLTLPLTIYTRHTIQQRVSLEPLLKAWSHQIRKHNMAKSGHLGPALVNRNIAADMTKKKREVYGRWNCRAWKVYLPLAQLPPWLLMVETLRGMAGTNKGLLGLIMPTGVVENATSKLNPLLEMAAAGMPEAGLLGAELVDGTDIVKAVVPVEPSLASEGMLWFPDLMAPDPLLILPFMLSGTLLLNIFSGQDKKTTSWLGIRFKRALGVIALAAGPLTLQMPTAILLYWVSSGMFGFFQGLLMDYYFPLKRPMSLDKPKKKTTEDLAP